MNVDRLLVASASVLSGGLGGLALFSLVAGRALGAVPFGVLLLGAVILAAVAMVASLTPYVRADQVRRRAAEPAAMRRFPVWPFAVGWLPCATALFIGVATHAVPGALSWMCLLVGFAGLPVLAFVLERRPMVLVDGLAALRRPRRTAADRQRAEFRASV